MEHHSSSRVHSVRTAKRSSVGTAIAVLLTVALIAAIIALSPIGEFLSDHLWKPFASSCAEHGKSDSDIVSALKNQEQTATSQPSVLPTQEPIQNSFSILETPYYILQMGAFTEQSDAESHAAKLRAIGAGGFVFSDGSVYRVFAAAYCDEQSLMKVQSHVRKDGFEASPYITERNSVHITLKGDPSAVKMTEDAVSLLSEIPNKLSSLSLELDQNIIDGINLRDALKEIISTIDAVKNASQGIKGETIDPILSVLVKYENRISTFLQEHDTISRMNAGEFKHLQIECIIDYIQFFEQE